MEVKSCLETCPPEVLSLVTRRLEGSDVMAMFLCGAPRLAARLFNDGVCSLRFDWSRRRYRIWYPFVMKFRKLRQLDIKADYERFFQRFELSPHFSTLEELSLSLSPPHREKEIRCLDFMDPITASALNLSQTQPNLKKLVLLGFQVSPELVSLLPPIIEHLDIAYFLSASGNGSPCTLKHIEVLPRSLTYLNLRSRFECSEVNIKALPTGLKTCKLDTFFRSDTIECFPRSLIHLEGDTSELNTSALHHMPAGIQTVKVVVGTLQTTVSEAEFPNLILPAHVTHLKILAHRNVIPKVGMATFPPSLACLMIEVSGAMSDLSHFEMLPRTLISIDLRQCSSSLTFEVVRFLPRGLKSLALTRSIPFPDDWLRSDLPPNLLSLDLCPHYTWKNEALGFLPRTLINVNLARMNRLNDVGVGLLPPSITLLNASGSRHLTGKCFLTMPRSLTQLMVDEGSSIQDHEISHLPRSLTYLRIWGAKSLTDKCFRMLPRRLETLVLDGPSPLFGTARIADLPQSLTVLTFVPEINRTLTSAYFSQSFRRLDSDEREDIESPIFLNPASVPTPTKGDSISAFFSNLFSKDFWSNT